ncbi:unnamed protein product [Phytomonas sp. Hart1]|nr:unnamed protein product [Phytomonas sp. Hart1]|eukprot:CCW70659.1 unnamed protein product [Phytomonas sp. isolate Hart1]
MTDELFDARNALVIGNYDQVISECGNVRASQPKGEDLARFTLEQEHLVACAQIGLGQYDGVTRRYHTATDPRLRALSDYAKLYAEMGKDPLRVDLNTALSPAAQEALTRLTTAAAEPKPRQLSIAILAGSALLLVHDYGAAVVLARKWLKELEAPNSALEAHQHIELHALIVEGLIQLNQIDQTGCEVAAMEKVNDEALITLLYIGIHALYVAQKTQQKEFYQKALDSFTDVIERTGNTVRLLNLIALSLMGLQMYDKAKRALLDALSIKSSDENTLVNLAVVSAHLESQDDEMERYLTEASSVGGFWGKQYAHMSDIFDMAAANHMGK